MRNEFIKTEHEEEALNECPWAAEIVEVEDGFHCFESVDDFKIWANQNNRKLATVYICRNSEVIAQSIDLLDEDDYTIEEAAEIWADSACEYLEKLGFETKFIYSFSDWNGGKFARSDYWKAGLLSMDSEDCIGFENDIWNALEVANKSVEELSKNA
jgi:hypothetical protein